MSHIDIECFMVVGQKVGDNGFCQGKPSVRVAMRKPSLSKDKIAIAMNLRLPISLFRRPALSATIVVPANQAPMEITPEIQTNIAQVLQEQLGITVHVTAPAPEQA